MSNSIKFYGIKKFEGISLPFSKPNTILNMYIEYFLLLACSILHTKNIVLSLNDAVTSTVLENIFITHV